MLATHGCFTIYITTAKDKNRYLLLIELVLCNCVTGTIYKSEQYCDYDKSNARRTIHRMRNMHFIEIEKLRFNYDARNARY